MVCRKLIDQEFFHTILTDNRFDLMYNDKIGLIEGQQIGSYVDMGMAPEGAYFEPTCPRKNKGDKLPGLNSPSFRIWNSDFTTCKHPEAATRFLNYLYTDQGYIDANFGTEGVTLTMLTENRFLPK